MIAQLRRRVSGRLFAQLGADPQGAEERQCDEQNDDSGRESNVEIGIGEVHVVVADEVPGQQRKDGEARSQEEGKERGGKGQQETLDEAEAFEGKPEK